ncbi:MAG: M28 family metallopeptidase [Planctomycetota bacterium]
MRFGSAPSTHPAPNLVLASLLLAALQSCGDSGPTLAGPVDGGRAMAHVEKFVEIGPRPFGSDNLAKTADYITGQIEAIGLKPLRHEVEHKAEKKTIRNLYTVVPGEDPDAGPILMIGAHYDTKVTDGCAEWTHEEPFVGAIDGGGAPAVLLELARAIKDKKPKCNVWLYWIDAEESIDWKWNDERALLGSEAFGKMLSKEKILPRVKAFVLLDLIGSKNFKIDKDGNSSQKLIDLFGKVAKDNNVDKWLYEFPTDQDRDNMRRMGQTAWGTIDDHMNFTKRGVPSVLLIDFARRTPGIEDPNYERWWHTPDDNLDAMSSSALAFTGNLVMAAFDELEAFVLGKKKGK